ncbi:hypothetical protein AC623_19560 [Bacillus sp. FJAT-27231]|uniref:DUF5342 family protein n=1 Tax=Bacillus sp. FJAT-27231 TaxID=1679168 RepID=UPI0006712B63|nr:DUF5342 family protein [Bacillus sp. FJAT-27231]KMY55862.1 hypothetical protein AC623_19560 [Bacillus sp. FJAT-27231]
MFQHFEVKPMFKDQVHERHQFKLSVQGTDYRGIFHQDEIHWFHPHPMQILEEEYMEAMESQVYNLMVHRLKQPI